MKTFIKDGKNFVKLSELREWAKNPRAIDDKDFQRLKTQILELGQYKPLLATKDGVVLGGNMRLKAFKDLGIDEVWVSVLDVNSEEEGLKYALSDNDRAGYYVNDLLIKIEAEFPDFEWANYAVDITAPIDIKTLIDSLNKEELSEDYSQKVGEVIYEPKDTNHKIEELYSINKNFDKEIEAVENEELKTMLRLRACNFVEFNFEKIADYYAYQATPAEQKAIEKLALVLLDRDKLIENGFSKLITKIDQTEEQYETE